MIPHFGEYIAFKLNPVASLESLKDTEVAKACETLETKTYVACVTYVRSLTLFTASILLTYLSFL